MKSIAELVSIALLSGLLASCASEQRTTVNSDRIVTNPIDLNYRFQPNDESSGNRCNDCRGWLFHWDN